MRRKGVVFLLLAGILWGCMGFFVRNMMSLGLDQIQIIFFKMFIGLIFLFVFLLIIKPELLRLHHWRDLWFLGLSGLLSMFGFNFFYFKAMEVTTIALAGVLIYVSPGITLLLSALLFHEKITVQKVCALLLIFGGCVSAGGVIGGAQNITTEGFIFCMGAAFCYGTYSIFGRIAVDHGYHPYTTTFYNMVFSLIGCLPLVDFSGIISCMSMELMMYGCGLSIPCAAIAYVFYTAGLQYVEASEAAMLATMDAVTAVIISVFVFGELLTVWTVLGVILIIGGICVMNLFSK